MTDIRVIVTGSRSWPDEDAVHAALNEVSTRAARTGGRLTVVHGHCKTGADRFAANWCSSVNGVTESRFPADWSKGKAAGPLRNQRMVDMGADLMLAFPAPSGESRGTADCMRRAAKAGIPIQIVSVGFGT